MSRFRELSLAIYPHLPYMFKNLACSYEGSRLKKLRFGGKFEQSLDWLMETQWWSAPKQHEYQLKKLRETVALAETSIPFYRTVFNNYSFKSSDIKSFDDLKKIPILRKAEVQEDNGSFINPSIPRQSKTTLRTSGTTGTPLQIAVTHESIQGYFAVLWRHRTWFGINRQMSHATFNAKPVVPPSQKKPPFWCHNRSSKQTLFSMFHMKDSNLNAYVNELNRTPRDYLSGHPSGLSVVADYMLEKRIKLSWVPKVVVTSSETLLDAQKKSITEAFQAPVADFYGMCEQAVSASQCPEGQYHFDFETGFVEIEPIGDDHRVGRVICTGFTNSAMPLIRYDTGDIVEIANDLCSCGRKGVTAKSIDGRIESYVRTPEGLWVGRLDGIYKNISGIKKAQIIQLDVSTIVVRIVKSDCFSKQTEVDLRNELLSRLGTEMIFEFEYVDEIQVENNGKFRAVISKL